MTRIFMNLISFFKANIYTFLANGTNLSFKNIFTIICLSIILGFYIFVVYKLSYKNAFYSKEFNLILPGMCITSSVLTIILHSSLIVFFGIISALSLIRFRHALKEPLDFLYLFWSLCTGIFCGCKLYTLVLLLCIFVTILFLLLDELSLQKNVYVLTVTLADPSIQHNEISDIIKPYCKCIFLKEIRHKNQNLYSFKVKTKKEDIFLTLLTQIPSFISLSFSSFNGDYRSN